MIRGLLSFINHRSDKDIKVTKNRPYYRFSCIFFILLFCIGYQPHAVQAKEGLKIYNYETKKETNYLGLQIKIKLNGNMISVEDTPGIIADGEILASYKDIFSKSKIKAACNYNKKKGSVTISKGGKTIAVTLNSKEATVNGKPTRLPAAPIKVKYVKANVTKILVPVQFITEVLGFGYEWDNKATVNIFKNASTIPCSSDIENGSTSAASDNSSISSISVTEEADNTGFSINTNNMAPTNTAVPEAVQTIRYNIKDCGATGNGDTNDAPAINRLLASIGEAGTEIFFPPGVYKIAENITFKSNVKLTFEQGAELSIKEGVKAEFYCFINAGKNQIFSGSGKVFGGFINNEVYPQWWGAIADGLNNDAYCIQAAIDSLIPGKTLNFSKGSFNLDNAIIHISKSISLKGSCNSQDGKLFNADILIENASYVDFLDFETENLSVGIRNAGNIRIENNNFYHISKDILGAVSITDNCRDILIKDNSMSHIKYETSSSTYGCGVKLESCSSFPVAMENISISGNRMNNIHGPAAIWVGGNGVTYTNLMIDKNIIQDTENMGIEFFRYSDDSLLEFTNCRVKANELSDIGSVRVSGTGSGCTGIYSNAGPYDDSASAGNADIAVTDNKIEHVLEIGIEGYYKEVSGNYIEDTGADQMNHPVGDNAGIYNGGGNCFNNTIVNPGENGGIYYYTPGLLQSRNYSNNIIRNEFSIWQQNSAYQEGDLLVAGGNWYICIKSGRSGALAPNVKADSIEDGTCSWCYRKPLAQTAITLNGEQGIQNIDIRNNTSYDFSGFLAVSAFRDNITITGNTQLCSANVEKLFYLSGYGSRICRNLLFENDNCIDIPLLNNDFSAFSEEVPDNWNIANGVIEKETDESGIRNLPKIIQSDELYGTRMYQTINIDPGLYRIEVRFKTNDAVKLTFFDDTEGTYLGEMEYSDQSGQFVEVAGLADFDHIKLVRMEISTACKAPAAENRYLVLEHIGIYQVQSR